MHPDVTCVIPNFNMADTLGTAIESAQRLGCRVFVSDDGSTDGSRDVIEACGVQAAYHESPSGGVARGLNEGLDACETEWVCWLDADDQLLAVEPLLVTGADWTVAPLAVVDDAGLRSTWDYAGWPTDLEGARAFARWRLSQPVSIRGAHRTAWLRENGLRHLTWPAGHHFGDDVLTCLEWLKARPRIVMIDTPCYLYRYRRRRWPHRDLFVRDLLAYLDEHERPHELLRAGVAALEILCPFTRIWAVDPFFDALETSDVPLADASFLAYVDSDDEALTDAVRGRLERLPCPEIRLHVSGWAPPDERAKRRVRHAAMRLATQGLVGPGPLLLLEDDTLVPPATYGPLARLEAPWAVGVQVGRWGQRCLGLWHVEKDRAHTLMPGGSGCNATGFYCVLTNGALYRSLDMWHWDDARGHDVSVTWGLSGIAIAWEVTTGHLTQGEVIGCDEAEPYEVAYRAELPICAATHGVKRRGTRGSVVRDGGRLRAACRIYGELNGRPCLLFPAGAVVPEDEAARLGLPVAP